MNPSGATWSLCAARFTAHFRGSTVRVRSLPSLHGYAYLSSSSFESLTPRRMEYLSAGRNQLFQDKDEPSTPGVQMMR
jgi:hypothetical protein